MNKEDIEEKEMAFGYRNRIAGINFAISETNKFFSDAINWEVNNARKKMQDLYEASYE